MMSCFQIRSYLQAPGVRTNPTPVFLEPLLSPLGAGSPQEEYSKHTERWEGWWVGEHLAEPCFPTIARAPQECCVLRGRQGEDERRGADGPDEAASERLREGEAEEPAAPGQPRPRAQPPACLQSGNVLPAAQRPGSRSLSTQLPSAPWAAWARELDEGEH